MIYLLLVVIFCCGRILLPGMEIDSDRIMPELAATVTGNAGVPWLAGLLLAAPFAAVMSSVDSFLLMVSSSVVRDIYQNRVNPNAKEARLKKLSYIVTVVVGMLAMLASNVTVRQEEDGATANEKFQAAVEVEDQSGWLGCGNHSNHLGQMNVVNVGDYKKASSEVVEDPKPSFDVVNDIYAGILFVRMNGHFMRLVVVLRSTLRSKVVVRKGPPPPRPAAVGARDTHRARN